MVSGLSQPGGGVGCILSRVKLHVAGGHLQPPAIYIEGHRQGYNPGAFHTNVGYGGVELNIIVCPVGTREGYPGHHKVGGGGVGQRKGKLVVCLIRLNDCVGAVHLYCKVMVSSCGLPGGVDAQPLTRKEVVERLSVNSGAVYQEFQVKGFCSCNNASVVFHIHEEGHQVAEGEV